MQDTLSLTFAALADPTRRAILAKLIKGEANISDLAKPHAKKMSLPAITKHLKVLEKAGLISKSRQAQCRPCKIKTETLRDAVDWMEQYKMFWEESFDRLGDYLKSIQQQESNPRKKK